MIELPDYLVDVVARQIYAEQYPPGSYPLWEDADQVTRQGCIEIAKMRLLAKNAQSDILR